MDLGIFIYYTVVFYSRFFTFVFVLGMESLFLFFSSKPCYHNMSETYC